MAPPLLPQLPQLPQLLLLLLLLLLPPLLPPPPLPLLLPLAAAELLPPTEELFPGRPVRIPLSGENNVTSFNLTLKDRKNVTRRLSIDLAFDPPSAQPRVHFPRPVTLLHDSKKRLALSEVKNLLTDWLNSSQYHVESEVVRAYKARQLRSSFLSPVRSQQTVSVYNVAMLHDRGPFPNGTLTLTLHEGEEPPCAGFFRNDEPCDSNGDCRKGFGPRPTRCVCEQRFTAPTCTETVSSFEEGSSNKEYNDSDFDVEPSSLQQQYVAVVQPFQTVYVAFNYSTLSMERGNRYKFSVRILKGTTSTSDKTAMQCEAAAAPESEKHLLPDWTVDSKQFKPLRDSSLFEANFTFTADGTRYIVALFANASHTTPEFNDVAAFSITTPQLIPQPPPVSRQRFLPQAMLPVCLSLIFVAGLAVLLVFWLDRRSGRSKMVDRLSEAELSRMYPVYIAERAEGECPICLSDMQHGDSLRALRCDHRFHAECLDPWLRENRANCPTCRASVRVDHLSDNHREPVCSRNRSCWSCLFCTSRDGDDGVGGHGALGREEQRGQDQEEQQQSLEPQRQQSLHGVRIAFPDRVHWPSQARTASSTPRTQSTAHATSETGSEDTSMHTALDLSFGSNRREQRLANVVHRASQGAEG